MNFSVGQIINNRYQLLQSIGFGSFGEVWLANDTVLNMNVAVKIYIALDSRGFKEFMQEFKTAYSLHHPNLLRADYLDSVDKRPYLIMPFCPESSGDRVGKMSDSELWKFIYDVSGGLAYLHENDIVHRDIKPDNILLNEQGVYVITDFGLSTKMRSTLRKASARQNEANNSGGTIGYMAPEMFSSSPQAVKATDIWAFGATLFELVTGEMPFCGQGGIMETYGAEIPDIPDVQSKDLQELIKACLSKDSWDRPTAHAIHNKAAESLGLNTDHKNDVDQNKEKQFLNDINSLQEEVKRLEAKKPSKWKKAMFIFLSVWFFCSFVIVGILLFFFIIMKIEYEDEIEKNEDSLSLANGLISNIMTIAREQTPEMISFDDWTSSNHTHNSTDIETCSFFAYKGDILSFYYDVDTEAYDVFKCKLLQDSIETDVCSIAGSKKSGYTRYTINIEGYYNMLLVYTKDGSVHSGKDEVSISNITVERSVKGRILQLLYDYYGYAVEEYESFDILDSVYYNNQLTPVIVDSVAY